MIRFVLNVEHPSRIFEVDLRRRAVFERGQRMTNTIPDVINQAVNGKIKFVDENTSLLPEADQKKIIRHLKKQLHIYWRERKRKVREAQWPTRI